MDVEIAKNVYTKRSSRTGGDWEFAALLSNSSKNGELSISETFFETEDMVAWEIGLFAGFCVSRDVFFEGVVSWKYGLMPMRVLLRRKKFCTKSQSDCR
jgi:hypothetical protein